MTNNAMTQPSMFDPIKKSRPTASVLADSISSAGFRMTTFEITLPKVFLAEINTHRALSRNYSSSRAIPSSKFVEIDSFEPHTWLKNQAGMTAKTELIDDTQAAQTAWDTAINISKLTTQSLSKLGLHKQWANRPNDWHIMAKGVISATEWNNFLWLRNDTDAQPELQELAQHIETLLKSNDPRVLLPGEWHLPYVKIEKDEVLGESLYFDEQGKRLTEEEAIMYSMACCAAVSYRTENIGIEKASDILKKLFTGSKVHASPSEHIATPMEYLTSLNDKLEYMFTTDGVTHIDRYQNLWSGNLKGFIQYRQLIPNNVKLG